MIISLLYSPIIVLCNDDAISTQNETEFYKMADEIIRGNSYV